MGAFEYSALDADGRELRGVLEGEQWEAFWQPAPDGPAGDHEVWVRRVR